MDGNATGVIGTNTMEPIPLATIPHGAKITYGMMVYNHRPLKKEKNM